MLLGIYFLTGILLSGLIFIFPKRKSANFITFIFVLIQFLFSILTITRKEESDLQYFTYDSLAIIFLSILAFISSATYFHSIDYTRESGHRDRALFYSSFMILNISLTGVYTANNLIVSWIFIELTTLSIAFLINHNRTANSLEATWKYIFVCSVGIALAYVGILFASTASLVGSTGDMSFKGLHYAFRYVNPVYMKMAFILILAGYSSKLEVFPLYTIGIDANYVAPAPVSAFLSSALVNGGFVAFFRVFSIMNDSEISLWINHVLLLTGILSLLVAAIYIQKATNLKRIFAYSTVEHTGLVLIALSLGKAGIYIALLQIIIHSFIKSGLFYQTGILHKVLRSYKLYKAGGYFQLNPAGAMILITGVVLITAIPPSGLFLSEFLLFRELGNSHWFLFVLVALLLTLIFYGIFMKNLKILLGEAASSNIPVKRINYSEYVTQVLFFAISIILCFYIPVFMNDLLVSVSGLTDQNFFHFLISEI
jgi:hydrogenase-4 component F